MKNLFAKLYRFFCSWFFLKIVLWIATLIVLFYVEEDWRGARAWAATKTKWEAQGELFDINRFIPSPIPDDQNLAAIPLFDQTPVNGVMTPVALQKALRSNQPEIQLPSTGGWQSGKLPDLQKIRSSLATNYNQVFHSAPPNKAIDQLEALYPFMADLRAASAARPYCQFKIDQSNPLPAAWPFELLTRQILLSKILTLHAVLALDEHQPDLAMEDIKVNFKLISGMKHNPMVVTGLIGIGMTGITLTVVYDGLAWHAWNDTQLADLENALDALDFLENYQQCMRGEVISEVVPNMEYFKSHQSDVTLTLDFWFRPGANRYSTYSTWPNGWLDLNLSRIVDRDLSSIKGTNPKEHRVFPDYADKLENDALRLRAHWYGYLPWNILFTASAPEILKNVSAFAQIQVWIDQARVVCALERYRLTHGAYPATLDELVPSYITEPPHDIIDGQPYRYQVRPDNTFLLYSIGWNQIDDKGKTVYKKDQPAMLDFRQGDWVWPVHPPAVK